MLLVYHLLLNKVPPLFPETWKWASYPMHKLNFLPSLASNFKTLGLKLKFKLQPQGPFIEPEDKPCQFQLE